MIIYLTKVLNLPLVKASNILSNFNGTANFTPLIGALIADSFAGRFWTIIFGSIVYELVPHFLFLFLNIPSLPPFLHMFVNIGSVNSLTCYTPRKCAINSKRTEEQESIHLRVGSTLFGVLFYVLSATCNNLIRTTRDAQIPLKKIKTCITRICSFLYYLIISNIKLNCINVKLYKMYLLVM